MKAFWVPISYLFPFKYIVTFMYNSFLIVVMLWQLVEASNHTFINHMNSSKGLHYHSVSAVIYSA